MLLLTGGGSASDSVAGVAGVLPGPLDFSRADHAARVAAAVRDSGASAVALLDERPDMARAMALVTASCAWQVAALVPAAALPVLVTRGRVPTTQVGGTRMVEFGRMNIQHPTSNV